MNAALHCELQTNDAGPERIDAKNGLTFDVRQLLTLGMRLNFDKVVEVPCRTDCPGPFAVGQNSWRARAARRETGARSAIKRHHIVTGRQLNGSETVPGQEWGFGRPLGFQLTERNPHAHDVPTA